MLEIFTTIASNLGVSIHNLILIISALGGFIFAGKDFRLATIYWFVIGAGNFLWMFTLFNKGEPVSYYPALVFMFLALVVMALNLLFVRKNAGVVI